MGECLRGHIQSLIDSGSVLDMTCPSGCSELMEVDIQAALTEEKFGQYQQFQFLARLQLEPNCRWCPNPHCDSGTVGDGLSDRLECDKCGTVFCFLCSQEYHEGMSCSVAEKARAKALKK